MDELIQATKEDYTTALHGVRLMLLNDLNALNWLALGSKLTDRKLYATRKQILSAVLDKVDDLATGGSIDDLEKVIDYLDTRILNLKGLILYSQGKAKIRYQIQRDLLIEIYNRVCKYMKYITEYVNI